MTRDTVIISAVWFVYGVFGSMSSSITNAMTEMDVVKSVSLALYVGFGMIVNNMINKASSDQTISELQKKLSAVEELQDGAAKLAEEAKQAGTASVPAKE